MPTPRIRQQREARETRKRWADERRQRTKEREKRARQRHQQARVAAVLNQI